MMLVSSIGLLKVIKISGWWMSINIAYEQIVRATVMCIDGTGDDGLD